jgi:hypothetical protein
VGILTSRNPDTPEGLEQTRAEKSYRTLKDSDRASALKVRGGLPTGREALRSLEPHHSPNKSMPSSYTKKERFASGISKMWCVCVSTPTSRGGGYL